MSASPRPDAARAATPRGPALRPGRLRRSSRDWADTLLRPHVLVALIAAVAAVPYFVGSFRAVPVAAPLPPLGEEAGEVLRETAMPLVIVGPDGAVRSAFATVRTTDHDVARLRATLVALRDALVEEGVWPSAVGAPIAWSFEAERRRVVVVDVLVEASVQASVGQEWAALRSLVETMRAAGADDVVVIVNGTPAATLWGQVSLP